MTRLLNHPQVQPLPSDEHFSVHGTLIQTWASKSFRPKAFPIISLSTANKGVLDSLGDFLRAVGARSQAASSRSNCPRPLRALNRIFK